MTKHIELLAPAGNLECLYAAVNAGCDAVYIGGSEYSARKNAKNFTLDEIEEALFYCHAKNVKLYITINTLYNDNEIEGIINFSKKLYKMGVDALIVQDIGLYSVLRKHFKDIEIHISTQMTVHTLEATKYFKEHGADRVVLSRELSLEETENIIKNSKMEIESFVHGALCMSYSGQCLMSQFIGGRSGNRGECAQPCRLPYSIYKDGKVVVKQKNILSLKDLNTLTIIPKLINSGITSFKIEGRMKSKEYVFGVVSIYRKYINMYLNGDFKVDEKDIDILKQLFNRGEMTEGYYTNKKDMIYLESPKHMGLLVGQVIEKTKKGIKVNFSKQVNKGDGIYIWMSNNETVGLNAYDDFKLGENVIKLDGNVKKGDKIYKTKDISLNKKLAKDLLVNNKKRSINFDLVSSDEVKIFAYDETGLYAECAVANNEASFVIEEARIKEQLTKTGDSIFKVDSFNITLEKPLNIKISTLNKMRRDIVENLEKEFKQSYEREFEGNINIQIEVDKKQTNREINILINDKNKIDDILKYKFNRVYIEDYKLTDEDIKKIKDKKMKVYVAMPVISKGKIDSEIIKKYIGKVDGFVVRNYGQLYLLEKENVEIIIGRSFNIYNSVSANYFKDKKVTISTELTEETQNKINYKNKEVVVYGKVPLMIMNQCIGGVCDSENATVVDRKDEEYILEKDCKSCINKIYSKKNINLKKIKKDTDVVINYIYDTPENLQNAYSALHF